MSLMNVSSLINDKSKKSPIPDVDLSTVARSAGTSISSNQSATPTMRSRPESLSKAAPSNNQAPEITGHEPIILTAILLNEEEPAPVARKQSMSISALLNIKRPRQAEAGSAVPPVTDATNKAEELEPAAKRRRANDRSSITVPPAWPPLAEIINRPFFMVRDPAPTSPNEAPARNIYQANEPSFFGSALNAHEVSDVSNQSSSRAFAQSGAVLSKLPFSDPPPTTQPLAQIVQTTQKSQGNNASKIEELRLPHLPNPPLPEYARNLLESLPEATQRQMKMSAAEIREMVSMGETDTTTFNNMTAFVGCLVEITSHGCLPHLAGEIAGLVDELLQCYSENHRKLYRDKRQVNQTDTQKIRRVIDPARADLLRMLPKYPQFTRMFGKAFNQMWPTQRTHLGIAKKFNDVLSLMKSRHLKSPEEFEQSLNDIIGDSSLRKTTAKAKTANVTESTPTSAPVDLGESDSNEDRDDDI